MRMKQVIKHKDVGLLNMIRRTSPVIQGKATLRELTPHYSPSDSAVIVYE